MANSTLHRPILYIKMYNMFHFSINCIKNVKMVIGVTLIHNRPFKWIAKGLSIDRNLTSYEKFVLEIFSVGHYLDAFYNTLDNF